MNNMNDMNDIEIYVPANELWGFYLRNIQRCRKEMILIAENTDTKYEVYMTDDYGTLVFSVCRGEVTEHEEYAKCAKDCEEIAKKLLLNYLIPLTSVDNETLVSGDQEDEEDEINEREDELTCAIEDFLTVALRGPNDEDVAVRYDEDLIQDTLHHILQYLTDEKGFQIYCPMFVKDGDDEVFCRFPYDEYKFC